VESLALEQLKLSWMEVSREAYPESRVYAMRHLEMYMGDADKWDPGFKKFNVSLLIALWVIIMLILLRKLFDKLFVFLQATLLKKLRLKYCYNIINSEENIIALQVMDKVKAYHDSIRKEEEQMQRNQNEGGKVKG